MFIDYKLLDRIIESALSDFFLKERASILNDLSERSLCARLSLYFEAYMNLYGLKGYYADTEYNRKQNGLVKTILLGKEEVVNITTDLIVHSRGEIPSCDNLIALEMAKINKSKELLVSDRIRLMTLTKSSFDGVWSNDGKTPPEHVCGYIKGLYVIMDHNNMQANLEYYYKGTLKFTKVIDF